MTILEKKIAKNIDIIKSGNITRLKRDSKPFAVKVK